MKYFTETQGDLPYDPWATHGISVKVLEACAQAEGVTFRQGDILLIRAGFMRKWYAANQEDRDALGSKPETLYVSLHASILAYDNVWGC